MTNLQYATGSGFTHVEPKSQLETALERNAMLALELAEVKAERDQYRALATFRAKKLERLGVDV